MPRVSQPARRRPRFMEIFSGAGTLSKAVEAHRFTSKSWDIEMGDLVDCGEPTELVVVGLALHVAFAAAAGRRQRVLGLMPAQLAIS